MTMQKILFPSIQPYDEGYLQVSDMHNLWYAQYGNPKGIPLIWLHGGPGGGCSENDACFFDPNFYRIILLDQRGAGKSTPFCEIEDNNTQNLVDDLEKLRTHLSIEKWLVFGSSWGSLLALCYAITHHRKIFGLILRGLYTGTTAEGQHFWYGVRGSFPDAWQKLYDFLPIDERSDLPKSYYKRIMDKNPKISLPAIKAFIEFDVICAYFRVNKKIIKDNLNNKIEMIGVAKLFIHYFYNSFFIEDNYIMKNINNISHLPCFIIHGRYDGICQASVAYDLHRAWPESMLQIVDNGGHTKCEPGIAKAIVDAGKKMQTILSFI